MSEHRARTRPYRPYAYAGLLPAVAALAFAIIDPAWRWTAIAAGYGYAALIFSFLGGLWWGSALAQERHDAAPWILAVAPSLIALATYMPWVFGLTWPGPSLVILGVSILASPIADRWIGFSEPGWLTLRWRLSAGLGTTTLLLALLTLSA